ncbi:hypothetical protein ACCS96_14225 [Rhizobium ruizarguesonis]
MLEGAEDAQDVDLRAKDPCGNDSAADWLGVVDESRPCKQSFSIEGQPACFLYPFPVIQPKLLAGIVEYVGRSGTKAYDLERDVGTTLFEKRQLFPQPIAPRAHGIRG